MVTVFFLASFCFNSCKGQKPFGTRYLKLVKVIPLPEVRGRIDHMDVDVRKQVLYLAALGNNTLEVIDMQKGRTLHTIKGLKEPQGVVFIPRTHEIFVANGGDGSCYFYDAESFEKTGTIQLSSDADNVRYDSVTNKIYVGYGNGGLAEIDAVSHRQTAGVLLPVHPESFQIAGDSIFVNLPDARMIAVLRQSQLRLLAKWPLDFSDNFPMAFDAPDHRLFVGCWSPARLLVIRTDTLALIASYPMIRDADDLYYDPTDQHIYVSGGGGSLNIFQQQDPDHYRQIASIPTRPGARTSLLVPDLHWFLVAERASGIRDAQVLVYKTGL